MPQRRQLAPQPARPAPARQRGSQRSPGPAVRDEWQPGAAGRAPSTSGDVLALQRRFGNRAVQGMLQLKRAIVSSNTSTRKFRGPRTDSPANDVSAVDKAPKGANFTAAEPIDVYEGRHANIADPTGFIAWYRIKSGKGSG